MEAALERILFEIVDRAHDFGKDLEMKNRWLIALSAVGIHASIGSVYAWSVFNLPLEKAYGWSSNGIALTFSLAIFFLGLSAALLGRTVERRGPRVAGLIAAGFWGAGLLGSSLATSLGSLPLLWLSYGVLGGIGLGIGYIAPVSTLVKWFPDRRGFATGLAIMGFGFGAMFGAPVFRYLIESFGIPMTFLFMGLAYFGIMLLSASYLEKPSDEWVQQRFSQSNAVALTNNRFGGEQALAVDVTAGEARRLMPFYGLWVMMFINITCGIAVIYSASPLAQESLGVSPTEAAAIVGFMSIFNGAGRLVWSTLSDYLSRPITYILFFSIQIVAFQVLPVLSSVLLFQIVLFTILSCYGGGFSTLPAYISDLFGTKELATIHGYILTAWAAAGLVGPQVAATVRELTGSYAMTLSIFSGVFVVALAIAIMMKVNASRHVTESLALQCKGVAQ